jgi:flagellin-specific chaperone FliS
MDSDAFLVQEIAASSPARLRFLLIQKAVGLCSYVESQWQAGQHEQAAQWMLRIQEILTELLEAVQVNNNPLAATVSDLYVYLSQLAVTCEQTKDVEALSALRGILEIEQQTWSMYVSQESRSNQTANVSFNIDEHADGIAGFDLQI